MDFSAWAENNKALWARVYDEVIAPDLEKEWKKRTRPWFTSNNVEDDRLRYLDNHISNGVVEKAQLVEENARLKTLLRKTRGNTLSAEELATSTEDTTIPVGEYRQVTEKLDELNKRYHDAVQRIKYLERKNVSVMQKNKEMKDSVKAWQEYCDRHIEKKKAKSEPKAPKVQPKSNLAIETPAPLPHIPSSPGAAVMSTPQSLMPQDRSSPAPMIDPSDATVPPPPLTMYLVNEVHEDVRAEADVNERNEREDAEDRGRPGGRSSPLPPVATGHADAISGPKNNRATFLGQLNSEKITSSQTTVPEVSEPEDGMTPRANAPMDDDEPEIVSERSLKRKRKPSTGFTVFHDDSSDGTPAKPVRVKAELHSSPPPDTAHQLLRKETMDLDELGPNPIMTPRRQRLRRLDSQHSNKTGTLRGQRSSSAPFVDNPVKPEPMEDVHMSDAGLSPRLTVALEDARAVSEPGHGITEPREVLQPIDPNVVAGRANEATPDKRVRREEARKEAEFNILAESGEEPPPSNERKKRLPPNLARAHFNERIRAAKSGPFPMKTTLTTPKTAPAKTPAAHVPTPPSTSNHPAHTPSARPARRGALEAAPRPELVPDGRPVWRMSALEARKTPNASISKPSTPRTRLRDKALSELRLQDFKPNPAYNGGYTHAFTDTVRRREDRLCLPGCTKPSCCGSTFRALALALPPLSSSQEEALLQDYLGDAYSSFGLTQMDAAEREEIVTQARTRQMAKEHGKHRRTYEGRKTPPGFWRVDFPSTQEEREDREKAVQMGLVEVRERYLEAMRRGGRFVFADE
ncbi:DNA repair protein/CtIP [Paraphaeosphaeria sporulosa]